MEKDKAMQYGTPYMKKKYLRSWKGINHKYVWFKVGQGLLAMTQRAENMKENLLGIITYQLYTFNLNICASKTLEITSYRTEIFCILFSPF